MKSLVLWAIAVTVSFSATSATVTPRSDLKKENRQDNMSEAERRAAWERNFMKRYGGLCEKPGSQQGKVVFVNGQSKVDGGFVQVQASAIEEFSRIKTEYVRDEKMTFASVPAATVAHKAQLAVCMLESPELPTLLVAPEAKWAVVNVTALAKDAPDSEQLKARVRKELWRAFAYTCGCGDSNDGRSVVQQVSSLSELDAIKVENFDPIQMQGLVRNLMRIGVTPKHIAPYKTACMRGWAPEPTNEYQKAIWDKVQADKERGPTNPITIPPPNKKK